MSMGRQLSPRYGHMTLVSGYSILTAVNRPRHGCAKLRLQAPTLARKCEISQWLPYDADGQTYGHVTTKISYGTSLA